MLKDDVKFCQFHPNIMWIYEGDCPICELEYKKDKIINELEQKIDDLNAKLKGEK